MRREVLFGGEMGKGNTYKTGEFRGTVIQSLTDIKENQKMQEKRLVKGLDGHEKRINKLEDQSALQKGINVALGFVGGLLGGRI